MPAAGRAAVRASVNSAVKATVKAATGFALAVASLSALAIDPFVIKDIRVEGLQRTEPGTVFSYLPVRVGDTLTDEKASESIRSLFATGFFRDVTIEVDGDVMVVQVLDRKSTRLNSSHVSESRMPSSA